MLTMRALSRQGLPHDIPPEASVDHTGTGWSGGFERDGSEIYRYDSPEGTLRIEISESFCEEPNEELGENHPGYWEVDKEHSGWDAECVYSGEETLRNLSEYRKADRSAAVYADSMESAQEAVEEISRRIPRAWLAASGASREKVLQGWKDSYSRVAGKVHAPMWI